MGSYSKKKVVSTISNPTSGGAGTDTVYAASLTIPTASVLTLNASPVQIIAAPGAGKYIEFISGTATIETYSGSPYATNTTLTLICAGATLRQAGSVSFLAKTVTGTGLFIGVTGGGATDTQVIQNAALNVSVLTGNPTNAGTGSDIKIKVLYRIVTV